MWENYGDTVGLENSKRHTHPCLHGVYDLLGNVDNEQSKNMMSAAEA